MKLFNYTGKSWIVFLAIALIMAGCSGGGGGSNGGGSGTPGDPALRMGVFLDSAVEGLNYKTDTQTGVTESWGVFWYREGETVTFSIGETVIGQTAAKAQVTPVDLVTGASDETHPKVTNICRLLQSLDRDGKPENGIQIPQQIKDVIKKHPLDLNLSTLGFEISPAVKNLLGELNGSGVFTDRSERLLPTADQARTHFRETMRSFAPESQISPLKTFATTSELEAFLKQQYASRLLSTPMYKIYTVSTLTGNTLQGTVGTADATGIAQPAGTTSEYSGTNIQEAGVDESDKVKTDGTYLYIAGNRKVILVQAIPADAMVKISTVVVKGTVDSLYLYNKMLVALYTPDEGGGKTGSPAKVQTGIMLIDATDPANPQVKKDILIDGSFVSSRLIGGKLHVIQRFFPKLPPFQLWYNGTEKDRADTVAANLKALSSLTLTDLMPGVQVTDGQGNRTGPASLVAPENFYCSDESGNGSTVTVTTFDLNDATLPWQSAGVAADAQTVYASVGSLYLTAPRHNYYPGMMTTNVSSMAEKTVVHKFDLTGDKVQGIGSGTVPGRILNQFSLGEHAGVLRVATTTSPAWGTWPTPANHVYCLQSGAGGLEVIGKLENLAPGERIYSARFIGTRGFLVTFVKVDPLFTLDLSDPAAPKVIGVLKVPGYSDYIHPLGENHLITIGKDALPDPASDWYRFQGVQLSIFDITDFANPKLLHKQVLGVRGTESEALHNHKAFTFWKEKNLLAFPVVLYEYQKPPAAVWEPGTLTFTGLYGYRVSLEKGFELLGRIPAATNTFNPYQGVPLYFYQTWMRGLFIGDTVYAVQPGSVSSAQINDIGGTVKQIAIDN